MRLENIDSFPSFLNPDVALPEAVTVACVHASQDAPARHVVGSAPVTMLPQTRALLTRLSAEAPELAEVIELWSARDQRQPLPLAA